MERFAENRVTVETTQGTVQGCQIICITYQITDGFDNSVVLASKYLKQIIIALLLYEKACAMKIMIETLRNALSKMCAKLKENL